MVLRQAPPLGRLMEFNPRVTAQSDGGERAQRELWERAEGLAVNDVLMPDHDDDLDDPTTARPKEKLQATPSTCIKPRFQFQFQNFGMWNVEILIPHSTFQNSRMGIGCLVKLQFMFYE